MRSKRVGPLSDNFHGLRWKLWRQGLAALFTSAIVAVGDGDCAEGLRGQAGQLASATEDLAIAGKHGYHFLRTELRHVAQGPFWGEHAAIATRAGKPEQSDPLPAIIDFHTQLEKKGIRLIVVPVPPKAVIHAAELPDYDLESGDDARLDSYHRQFYDLLAAAGVEVLDLTPELAALRRRSAPYCKTDSHWSGAACVRVAELVAARLATEPWIAGIGKREMSAARTEISFRGDLVGDRRPDAPTTTERQTVREVRLRSGASLAPDANSPVLLLGDSHTLVFHAGDDLLATDAGLFEQLSLELGFAVDLLGVRGSGSRTARISLLRRARKPGYLEAKKVVVWVFAARELSEAAWGKVPVVR